MKLTSMLLVLAISTACSTHKSPSGGRSVSSYSPLRQFLEAAVHAGDNTLYKSAEEMQEKLLREVKANPARFGFVDEAQVAKLKSLEEVKSERVLAEVLAEASTILRFTSKMKQESMKAISKESGIAARMRVGALKLDAIKLAPHEETGLGRNVSLRLKGLKSSLVERKIASVKEADEIYKTLFQASQELSQKAGNDPRLLTLSRQIVEYSTAISERTGKKFLGRGGCMKISGKDVLQNKAEIAYKTMSEVEERGLESYDDIGKALQRNHSEVTERVERESCLAIKALTVGEVCGNVYARELAPKDC